MASVIVRRGLKGLKWLGIGLLALVALALVVGTIYEQWARADAAKRFPPRGTLVDIGGRRIHIDCRGSGSPTVILESGLDINGSLAWAKVQDKVAKTTRTCSYDRAGIMWSDPRPGNADGDQVARDLHAALGKAGIAGPLVLAGHSLGGPYIMNYTRQFGGDVAGLVFVDASHPDQLEKLLPPGKKMPEGLPLPARIMAALSWAGTTRLIPAEPAPNELPTTAPMRSAYMSKSMKGAMAEMDALPTILKQGGQLRDLGNRPIVVLTAAKPYPQQMLDMMQMTPAEGKGMQARWEALHKDEASWSTRSRQEILPDATHYVQYDRPDAVIRAIDEVVAAVRADTAKPQ
jgi:pimeloyl-ACP methyl ester carboxylesterase